MTRTLAGGVSSLNRASTSLRTLLTNVALCSRGCRVAVVLVFALLLQLPSSSSKFVNMTVQALEQFAEEGGFKFKKITPMPLEGDGTIRKKVSRLVNGHVIICRDPWSFLTFGLGGC